MVVGATADAAGLTRAAAWSSRDARSWQPLGLHPRGDYYAARAILTSAGCSRGRLAVLGAKSGGAHGNPRTATWTQLGDGSLAAVHAPFVLFGGSQAVDVSRLSGGPDGYLVTGTRTSGAAVWTSRTGALFRLHAGEPGLADGAVTRTQAVDAVPGAEGWVVVGTSTDQRGQLRATTWTGLRPRRWDQGTLPGRHTVSTADRAVTAGSAGPLLVAGVLDHRFGLWVGSDDTWALPRPFGRRDPGGTAAPYVSGLGRAGGLVLATYSDGSRFRLAAVGAHESHDLRLPTTVSVDGEHAVTLTTHADTALLLTDDSRTGRAWFAAVP
jgi:hypothetical protein